MDRYVLLLSWGERRGEGAAAGGPGLGRGPGAGTAAGRRGPGGRGVWGAACRGARPSSLNEGFSLRSVVWDLRPRRLFWIPTSLNPPVFLNFRAKSL